MINLKFILISLIVIVLISACAMGPNFTKPEPETPEVYSIQDSAGIDTTRIDSLINLNWWKLFEDSVLDTLVTIALLENKNVNIALAYSFSRPSGILFTVSIIIIPKTNINFSS